MAAQTASWPPASAILRLHRSHYILLAVAIVVGLGLRFFLAAAFFGDFDETSYEIVVNILYRGGIVYNETARYNYSPLWSFILRFLASIAGHSHLPFHLVVRSFLSLVDLADAVLIAAIASKVSRVPPAIAFSAYLLNPVPILIVGYQGQFDNLTAMLILLGVYVAVRGGVPHSDLAVWLSGTLAILIKQNLIFSVWMLFAYHFRGWRRVWPMGGASLIFLGSFLPYLFIPRAADNIVNHVFQYASGAMSGFALLPDVINRPVFFAVMVLLPFIAIHRLRLSLSQGVELAALAFLTFTYGISEQQFILPVIFGAIFLDWPFVVYSAVGTFFLLNSWQNVHVLDFLGLYRYPTYWFILYNLVWFVGASWFVWAVYQSYRNARMVADRDRKNTPRTSYREDNQRS